MTNIQWYPLYKLLSNELKSNQLFWISGPLNTVPQPLPPTDRPWTFYLDTFDGGSIVEHHWTALHDLVHLWLKEHDIEYQLSNRNRIMHIGMNSDDMVLFILYWKF
jgi:hypothetical protein